MKFAIVNKSDYRDIVAFVSTAEEVQVWLDKDDTVTSVQVGHGE